MGTHEEQAVTVPKGWMATEFQRRDDNGHVWWSLNDYWIADTNSEELPEHFPTAEAAMAALDAHLAMKPGTEGESR